MLKTVTWQQVAILSTALVVAGLAHWKLGANAGAVTGLCATLIAFMLGRDRQSGDQGPSIIALLSIAGFLVQLTACNQPQSPQQVSNEIEAGVAFGKDVCQEVGVATGDPIITLICPFLDKNGQKVSEDGGFKTITVKMSRASWEAMKVRDGG